MPEDQFFTVNSINGQASPTKARIVSSTASPVSFDSSSTGRSVPFIWNKLPSQLGISIWALRWAYHAANSLFKHPTSIKRCVAMSAYTNCGGIHGRHVRRQLYFNNPSTIFQNASDPWFRTDASCDITLQPALGRGKQEDPTMPRKSLVQQGIRHSSDNWGPQGGHGWPYWKYQMTNMCRVILRRMTISDEFRSVFFFFSPRITLNSDSRATS